MGSRVSEPRPPQPPEPAADARWLQSTSPLPPGDTVPFQVGDVVGKYELIHEIGGGGMGLVFLARDTELDRQVAIKLVRSLDERFIERFGREARATARCQHENVVRLHDAGAHEGWPFLVLEYLEGQTIGALIKEGPLAADRAVALMTQVTRGLVCAHDHGIVHRDLKPDNLFVTFSGTVKVLDFGIAKFLHDEPIGWPMVAIETLGPDAIARVDEPTGRGAVLGTVSYMSPEQWCCEEPVDERSDVWAIGIILYTLVTGTHPLAPPDLPDKLPKGADPARMVRREGPIPSIRDTGARVSGALADIIDRCLEIRREERMASARDLLEALESLQPEECVCQAGYSLAS